MSFSGDWLTAKFLGASTDNALKYAAIKSFLFSDNTQEGNYTNQSSNTTYYSDRNFTDNQQNQNINKQQEPIKTIPLEPGEIEELKENVVFDGSDLPLYFMQKEAEEAFSNEIGIYKQWCTVKINPTQKKYLDKYIHELLSCKSIYEMKEVKKLYISNSGLYYLNYFSALPFLKGLYPVQVYLQRILSMKIKLTKKIESIKEEKQISSYHSIKIITNNDLQNSDNEILEQVKESFLFYISEIEFMYFCDGWVWHAADKESAEIWAEKYPEKMIKYQEQAQKHFKTIKKYAQVIKKYFNELDERLRTNIQSLSTNQKKILLDYLDNTQNCKELDDLFKIQHDVYYGDGFGWILKIIPYNDKNEPEIEIRKRAFDKYRKILKNEEYSHPLF